MSTRDEIMALEQRLREAELGPDPDFFEQVLADEVLIDGERAKAKVVAAHRPGAGPKFTKVGRRVFYASVDLTTWVERGGKRSTSDPGKTTVLPAIPVSKRAIKLDGGVR